MSGPSFEKRHGSPYDRGSADRYYGRPYRPHFFAGGTGHTPRLTDLTPMQLEAYAAGYEEETDVKDWGTEDVSATD